MQSKIVEGNILKKFFIIFFEKIRIGISCELSAWQTIHMKYQALFSMKNKKNTCI